MNAINPAERDLRISGYASRLGERDLGGDTVRPGAFAASLLIRPAPRPMLFDHDTSAPVGVWDRVVEDATGLWVEGRIQAGTPGADRLIALVRSRAVDGLSIGFRTVRAKATRKGHESGRDLLELELWEVSVVTFPMLPTARLAVSDTAAPDTLTPTTTPSERIAA